MQESFKKKIILISPFFASPAPGGSVTLSREICEEWLGRGFEVHVFGIDYSGDKLSSKETDKNQNLFFHGLIRYSESRLSHKMSFSLKEKTREVISSISPAEIHIHNFHGMLGSVWAAVESGFKTIYTGLDFGLACQSFYLFDSKNEICGGPESEKCLKCVSEDTKMDLKYFVEHFSGIATSTARRDFSSLRKHLAFFSFKNRNYVKGIPENLKFTLPLFDRFDHIIAPSPPMAQFVAKYRTKGQVHDLSYPISKNRICEDEVSESDKLKFLYLGNPAKVKGWSFFLSVLENLPNGLDLEITDGSGLISLNKTNKRIRRYLKVSNLISSENVSRAIKECDATLVPSLWYENTPLVTLESLANQRPVIAADQPGISHVVHDGKNGFLLPSGDIKAWVDGIIQWARDPKKVREMRGQCTYTFDVNDYLNALEKAIL